MTDSSTPAPLTPEARAELRRLAREATPGKRVVVYESCDCGRGYPCHHEDYAYALEIPALVIDRAGHLPHPALIAEFADADECTNADAEFIAACDRDTVLSLLAERDAMAERVERAEAALADICGEVVKRGEREQYHNCEFCGARAWQGGVFPHKDGCLAVRAAAALAPTAGEEGGE